MRRAHEVMKSYNKKMDDLRARKDTNYDRLRTLRDALDELKKAEAKLIVCERLGGVVQPSELVEDSISLENNTDKIGPIVGKGGGTLRQKESEYGVSIDIDRKQNAINLLGTEEGVAKRGILTQVRSNHIGPETVEIFPINTISPTTTKG